MATIYYNYRVITPSHPMYNTEFVGYEHTFSDGEERIINSLTTGQSYPKVDCECLGIATNQDSKYYMS